MTAAPVLSASGLGLSIRHLATFSASLLPLPGNSLTNARRGVDDLNVGRHRQVLADNSVH